MAVVLSLQMAPKRLFARPEEGHRKTSLREIEGDPLEYLMQIITTIVKKNDL